MTGCPQKFDRAELTVLFYGEPYLEVTIDPVFCLIWRIDPDTLYPFFQPPIV